MSDDSKQRGRSKEDFLIANILEFIKLGRKLNIEYESIDLVLADKLGSLSAQGKAKIVLERIKTDDAYALMLAAKA